MVELAQISRLSGLDQSEILKENDSFNDTSMFIHEEHNKGEDQDIINKLK